MQNIDELIQEQRFSENYLVEKTKHPRREDYTIVYFSSNGIFGGSDLELFKEKIIKKNVFEFYKTRIIKGSKHIFLRDLTSKWYLDGINNEINSIEGILELLRKETKGSKIITVGSSAGGYAAVLFGILLNAECIFSFCGQFSLTQHAKYVNLIEKYGSNKYFDLLDLIKTSDIPIYYMLSSESQQDMEQYELLKDLKNVKTLCIKSRIHGVPVTKTTLKNIINSYPQKLDKMFGGEGKPISEMLFLLKHFGFTKMVERIIEKNMACFKQKTKKC